MSPAPAAPDDESWLGQVADHLDDLLWVSDPAQGGRITFANAAFTRFFGRDAASFGSLSGLAEAIHTHDRERLRQRHARALAGDGFDEEYRALAAAMTAAPQAAPRSRWLRERAVPVRGADGRVQRVTHIARDVTWMFDTTAQLRAEISRRADAERSLDDANTRLRALIDSASDAVVTIDANSRIIDWNSAAERIFGWQREEALGQVLTELIVPQVHRTRHHGGMERYFHSGHGPILNRRVETTALRRNGEEFDVELSVWPVRSGDVPTFSSFIRDISRRKQAERALGESETKYRAVVENVNEGILVTAQGRILYANPRALDITGLSLELALARPFIEFIHAEDRERVLDNHLRRLRGEPVENHYQFRVVRPDGQTVWLEISAVVFEWQGAPATLNFLSDVTLRRQAEAEIRSALQRERELSELKSRFAAMASHEFRTPLAAILSSVELLDDYSDRLPASERREMLGMIKSAVARMNDMVDRVLLTARLESGRLRCQPQPLALPPLLARVAGEVARAHGGDAAARLHISSQGLEAQRQIDEGLLRHILANLLGNALKYSGATQPVHCHVQADGERVHLAVSDRGIGIPAADLPRLFESFHRATNVGNVQGTGIGLSIVKECVNLHGGQIEVHSAPGEGTTFRLWLHAPLAAGGHGGDDAMEMTWPAS